MADKKISDLVDGGAPQPTDEFVVARGATNNKIAWSSMSGGAAQTAISGLANSETTYSSGTVSLSELGAITIRSSLGQQFQFEVPATSGLSATGIVSLSTNGSTISIGASQSVQTQNAVDVTLSGNTAGALALVSSGTLTLAGGNNITVSQAGNAITISGPNAAGAQTGISGIVASNATYTSGTVTITGVGGGVTVSSNTGQRIDISVAAQSVQPETQTFIGGISASNTLYTSGSVRISGSNAATVKSGTGQLVIIDVPVQSTQPETQTFIGGISASDTLYTSGSVRFTGSNAVTVRSDTGQLVVIDAPATSSLSATGIVSVSTNGSTISIGASQTAQTDGIILAGVSTGGNTSGNTQVSSGTRLVFAGGNNITLSQGTAANATTITISGPNTAAAAGATVSQWPAQGVATNTVAPGALFSTEATRTTLSANVWPVGFEANLSVNKILIPAAISASTATTTAHWGFTMGFSLGLYTMNAGTLSLVSSFSNQQRFSYSSAANSTNASATWQMSYGAGTVVSSSSSLSTANAGATNFWSSVTNLKAHPYASGPFSLSAGQYVGAFIFSLSTSGALQATMNQIGYNSFGALLIAEPGRDVASTTANSFLQGRVSMTQTNSSMAVSFSSADVTTASNNASFMNRPMALSLFSAP